MTCKTCDGIGYVDDEDGGPADLERNEWLDGSLTNCEPCSDCRRPVVGGQSQEEHDAALAEIPKPWATSH